MTVPVEPASAAAIDIPAAAAAASNYPSNLPLVQDDTTITLHDDYIESLKQHLPQASESRAQTRWVMMHEIVPKILNTINIQMDNAKRQGLYLFEYHWPMEKGHLRDLVFEILRRMGYTVEFVRKRTDGEGAYWRISWAKAKGDDDDDDE
jgi:hypothetical protein